MSEQSRITRMRGYRWDAVDLKEYKTEGSHFRDITRQTLMGEREDQQALAFLTRYFEVQPGGYSTLERHEHAHAVIILRGEGEVILNDRVERVAAHDCVYIAPWSWHQFHATGEQPLGFLCMVNRERDRPQLPAEEDLERLRASPAVAKRLRG
ncbi:cupin domain-containing protein [Alkalilimnicola sp. S0819]|uniref:cupin domain-containing protein n=1 Tax=Alkalilimnicola sp. S0819 TaxID=2613922 RepID=UPI0012621535|nr:cupin domain-containing protein [Alkalilimnicola sp. S0819]KAB7627649.1 cupin domain-containing protein [Alkalilimnicola sp. S0819]MPQ15815.1 cupin domain-containing protein [Alkalilimnicola sp. S0819]